MVASQALCGNHMLALVGVMVFYFLVRNVMALYDHSEHPFRNAAWSATAIVTIALPLALLNTVYGGGAGRNLVLAIFVMIWLNDTGAYCTGSLLGRHKMFPRVSPKKSWEGFACGCGGLVLRNTGLEPVAMACGRCRGLCGVDLRRPVRKSAQAQCRHQGFRQSDSRPWRYSGPHRLPAHGGSCIHASGAPVLNFTPPPPYPPLIYL